MAEKTAIEWCDATFNPWWGCQKVSPACDHCYAERDAKRFAPGRVLWGVGSERRTFGDEHWEKGPLKWAKTMPAKLGRRPRVFCASMADWLDLDAPIDEFVRLLDTIRRTPELDWLLLSKRIGNWLKRLDEARSVAYIRPSAPTALHEWIDDWINGAPPPNVWLGATVVTQEEADRDVPKLLKVPVRVRFLSVEPMLGPVQVFSDITGELLHTSGNDFDPGSIDWIIAGGESGPKARPSRPDWFRSLRDQCAAAGVPFLFKQWGEWSPGYAEHGNDLGYGLICQAKQHEWSEGHCAFRVGKAAAGRLLDGRTHDEFPRN